MVSVLTFIESIRPAGSKLGATSAGDVLVVSEPAGLHSEAAGHDSALAGLGGSRRSRFSAMSQRHGTLI
jgi:hypothetical protein